MGYLKNVTAAHGPSETCMVALKILKSLHDKLYCDSLTMCSQDEGEQVETGDRRHLWGSVDGKARSGIDQVDCSLLYVSLDC